MDLTVCKDHITQSENAYKSSVEHPVDCNITLPDYMPPITRILRCNAQSGVQTHQITGDRITAECDCLIRILYVCSEGKLHCFDQTVHFGKQLEFKGNDTVTDIFVGAKTDYINYRVSGQRAFEVHGSVTVYAKAQIKKELEFLSSAEGDGITTRNENATFCDLALLSENMFTVSEECEINNASEKIGTIIESSAKCIVDEIKVIKDKLFLKGELIICTAYLNNDDTKICTVDTTVAINRIIEAQGITEKCKADAEFTVLSLDVRPKYDSASDKSYIDVSATIQVSAKGYEERKLSFMKDAYSTKYEAEIERAGIITQNIAEPLDEIFLCRDNIDLSSSGISEIYSFICSDITSSFSTCDEGVIISGLVTVHIIYKDSKGEFAFTERQIPYEYKKSIQINLGTYSCLPHCTVTARNFVLTDANTIDARIEINVQGLIFFSQEYTIIKSLNVNKEKMKILKTAALTVYFADKGETLWDIAEKYNTTVDAIIRENHIPDGTLTDDIKLLIPKI